MAKYLWSILAICGLAIILYGIILFVAMPAAGTAVAMTGLICLNIGIKKNQKNEKVLKGKLDSNEKSLRSKAFKITVILIYLSNLFLISSILPNFQNLLGDNFGFIVSALIGFTVTIFYTGIILSFFQTIPSLIIVGIITWSTILLRVIYHK